RVPGRAHARRDPRRRAGTGRRVVRQRLGQAGDPPRVPHGRARRHVGAPDPQVLRQGHLPGAAHHARRRSAHRPGGIEHPRRRVRAVLAPGTILTGSTPVYDLVRDQVYRRAGDGPLEIPAGAVVVPGARGAPGASAARWGISLYAPVIVKYRDEKTDAATLLEEYLR